MSAPAPALYTPPLDDASAVAANDAVVRRIEAIADRFATEGALEDAAACAHLGSYIAWMNHPGRFACAPLERTLRAAAAALPVVPYRREVVRDPRRVLHVLSEGYTTGGHTRLAWRWMFADAGRVHALAMTRHKPVPTRLVDAVNARGGVPVGMPPAEATLLERAAWLRSIAVDYDLVLLYVHPDDPIPSIAFGGGAPRPPVVHVNHADHCYWLGREVADVIVNQRELGTKLACEQRGIPASRNTIVPLPLQGVAAGTGDDRENARRELGLRPDQVLLLTVASAYKFGPVGGAHFLDAVEPVVARHPQAVLLAVGPPDSGRFADARRRTGGRIRALGGMTSVEHMYAAADVYLESYPCSSGTAVREAAAHGVPVLTFAPDPVESEMLGSDISLAELWQRGESVEEYGELAAELILDSEARARWGDAARRSVADAHDEQQWVSMVEDVYRLAFELGPVGADELEEPNAEHTPFDTLVHRIHAYNGKQIPLAQCEGEAGRLELISQSPAVRLAYGSLSGPTGGPEQRLCYPLALAAPGADAGVISATVEAFRQLAMYAVVESFKMVVSSDLLDHAVPLIEAALEVGADIDIDLVVADDPLAGYQPGTLLVVSEGDALGELPAERYPHQHRAG
jgi:hypothetical protein